MSIAVTHHEPQIEQILFVSKTPDGRRFAFAFLHDGRCAVLRDGQIEHACDGDENGVSAAFERFCKITHHVGQRTDVRDTRPS